MNTPTRPKVCTAVGCLAAAIAACAAMIPAHAGDDSQRTRVVRFDDLDIGRPAGAQALYRRIKAAAREVCSLQISRNLASALAQQDCLRQAIDQAVRNVNAVELTELRFGSTLRTASK